MSGEATTNPLIKCRPEAACGTFLRILTVNDVYKLDNYPFLASAIKQTRAAAPSLDCTFISTMPGDFLSPCIWSALDGGKTMTDALSLSTLDYLCLGNHEFDLGFENLSKKLAKYSECGGKTINSNCTTKELDWLPRHDVIAVGDKKALIGGFCTADLSIYAPSKMPSFNPIDEALVGLWKEFEDDAPDVYVPMTHQLMAEDRRTGDVIASVEGMRDRTPVLLGGHDHEPYLESIGGGVSSIFKVGEDAVNIGIVDIWWDDEGKLRHDVSSHLASLWQPDEATARFVDKKAAELSAMMDTPIARLPVDCSSKTVRFEECFLPKFLLSFVKDGFRHENVDIAMIQAGAVRGGADYAAGPFTMGNLFAEFAFDCEQAILKLPGSIISESAYNSRNTPKPAPNFLHFDAGVSLSAEGHIETVNGVSLDPERLYTVAVYQFLVAGGNAIEPLLGYVQQNLSVPGTEACPPVKDIVLSCMIKKLWRNALGVQWKEGDRKFGNKRVLVAPNEQMEQVDKAFEALDDDGNGHIDLAEFKRNLTSFSNECDVSLYHNINEGQEDLLEQMLKTIDTDGDGKINKEELRQIVF